MNNSDTHSKGGFLRRFFARSTPSEDNTSLNQSGEIIMPSQRVDESSAKRLPKAKTILVVAADDAATRRWRRELENTGYGIETVADGIQDWTSSTIFPLMPCSSTGRHRRLLASTSFAKFVTTTN